MPYTDDKQKKLSELFDTAFEQLYTEPNFESQLEESTLTPLSIKDSLTPKFDEIWASSESAMNAYREMEHRLNNNKYSLQIMQYKFIREHNEYGEKADRLEGKELDDYIAEIFENDRNAANFLVEAGEKFNIFNIQRQEIELANIASEIDSQLIDKLKAEIRLKINEKLAPNYDTRLTIPDAPGLAEVSDPSAFIDTSAKGSLEYMLKTMKGGSIGIAGSRGAGKSTLIRMFCGEKPVLGRIGGLPVLTVFTSAPVQYQSRDFILYLFSAVCNRVIDPFGTAPVKQKIPEIKGYSKPPFNNLLLSRFLYNSPPKLLISGMVIAALSLILAILLSFAAVQKSTTTANTNQNTAPANSQSNTSTGNENTAVQTAQKNSSGSGVLSFIDAFTTKLGINAGTFFFFGILMIISAYLISRVRDNYFTNRNFFPETYSEFTGASDQDRRQWQNLAKDFKSLLLTSDYPNLRSAINNLEKFESDRQEKLTQDTLKNEAEEWLREIKFQQSYTAGWSGALKLPVGLEGSVNKAVTLAQLQMSNPEIVASFIGFLKQISKEYKVIIGIDELDKIESDIDAQKFLNEIKSIFGLNDCFYLISVSENAMSNFERRGLPFRDAFDSSFDNVVYVDKLNHKTAKELLLKRIIGKPLPFIYLCYCLSGGLPRDLIRYFRNLLELNSQKTVADKNPDQVPGMLISELCEAIVSAEIKAKIRAVGAVAKKIEVEPETNKFVEKLFQIDSEALNASALQKIAGELLNWQAERKLSAKSSDEEKSDAANCKKIKKLSLELSGYIYFLHTILQFFNNNLDMYKINDAANDGDLETLANSRRLMEVNPAITISLLNNLRTKWDWETI